MEPTSSPDNTRQSRGLARFWPVHGMPAPVQRQSDEDAGPARGEEQAAEQSPAPEPEAPEAPAEEDPAHPALTSDTQMVALGSRRAFDPAANNARMWTGNQGGFPPVESERPRNGDNGPRHGGGPVPNGLPPAADVPPAEPRSPFAPPASPFAPPGPASGGPLPVPPSPFAPPVPPARPDGPPAAAPGRSDGPAATGPGRPDGPAAGASGRPEGTASVPPGPAPDAPGTAAAGNGAPDRDPRGAIPLGGAPGSIPVPVPDRRRPAGEPATGSGGERDTDTAERGGGRRRAEDERHAPGLNGTAGVAPVDGPNGAAAPADRRPATGGPAASAPPTAAGTSAAPHARAPQRTEASGADDAVTADRRGMPTVDPRATPAAGARGRETAGSRGAETADRGVGAAGPRGPEAAGSAPPARDAADGRARRPDGTPWPDRSAAPRARPAAGWATVPTSGIPTLTGADPAAGSATPTAPATPNAPATEDQAGRRSTPPAADATAGHAPQRFANLEDADRMTTTATTPDRDTPARPADGMPRAGRRAADAGRRAAAEPAEAGLRPGDVHQIQIAFWDEEAIAHYRSAWHELRGDFVDDPVTALTRAHDLLTEAVNELTEALLAERDELDPLRSTATPDTESMRMAMRGYREFLERILAL